MISNKKWTIGGPCHSLDFMVHHCTKCPFWCDDFVSSTGWSTSLYSPWIVNIQIIMTWQKWYFKFCYQLCLLIIKKNSSLILQRQSSIDNFKHSNLTNACDIRLRPLSGFHGLSMSKVSILICWFFQYYWLIHKNAITTKIVSHSIFNNCMSIFVSSSAKYQCACFHGSHQTTTKGQIIKEWVT